MTTIPVEGFEVEATITDGRLSSLPFVLCLEYCSGRQDVWYFAKRSTLYVAYAKQLALLVTDENIQKNELYQPYHLNKVLTVVLNEKGEPSVTAMHPPQEEDDRDRIDCTPQHDRPFEGNPWRVLEAEGALAGE